MSHLSHYFIAIPLDHALKDYFSQWQDSLKELLSYKQWPHKQDLHITLKFLGPVAPETLKGLINELKSIEQLKEFELNLGTIGTFGNPLKPRVLWAGVEKTDELVVLQNQVEECAGRAGFAKEKRECRPHITLAKKWAEGSDNGSLANIKNNYNDQRKLYVNEVVIYQIFLNRSPKYEIIHTYHLG
ncbi:MAG TPA: RNA 2',3'-cyclic phosphodiesterase [Bacillales bacterium]|nr:RNA 2',3'-cyclic phosphodiesterase [Bacillales bacterium]